MTADDLVEKVARRLCAGFYARAHGDWPPDVRSSIVAGVWADWREEARAALRVVREALAEPDENMIHAGFGVPHRRAADSVWRAMLAASPLGRGE